MEILITGHDMLLDERVRSVFAFKLLSSSTVESTPGLAPEASGAARRLAVACAYNSANRSFGF